MIRSRRGLLVGGLHLAVLWSFAIAKPLLDVLDDDPGFFVAHNSTPADLIFLALGLVLIPPAVMLAIELIADLIHRGAGRVLQLGFVGILAAAFALLILKGLVDFPAGVMIGLALAAGAAFAAAYSRGEFIRTTLTVLSPAPLLFAFLFLFTSPVSDLVNPPDFKSPRAHVVGNKGPLVMVIFDEFPVASLLRSDGQINAQRYPAFATMAGTSTWYRDATTSGFSTTQAVPSLLSGDVKSFGTTPVLSTYPDNLFTELRGHYHYDAIETVTHLCPDRLCPRPKQGFISRNRALLDDIEVVEGRKLLPDSIANTLPDVSESIEGFVHQNQIPLDLIRYQQWVNNIPGKRRTLDFFHIRSPHAPWRYLPHGHSFEPTLPDSSFHNQDDLWVKDEPVIQHFWQRHLLQTGYTDWLLHNLITKLKAQGVWNEATVVITADHGGAFYPGLHRRTPTPENLGAIAPVPLFIKASGQTKGRVVNRHICTNSVLSRIDRLMQIRPAHQPGPCPNHAVDVNGRDDTATASLARVRAEFKRLLANQTRLFGSGPWSQIFAYGPYGYLVGTDVSAHPSVPPANVQVKLIGAGAHRASGLKYPGVRALVHGEISGNGVGGDQPVVVALDGRIRGIGTTYDLNGQTGLGAMIPPTALYGGVDITLYRVLKGGRLQPLPLAPGQ